VKGDRYWKKTEKKLCRKRIPWNTLEDYNAEMDSWPTFFSSSYRFFHPVIVMDKFIDGPALSMALLVPIETKNEEKNSVIDRYSIRKQ